MRFRALPLGRLLQLHPGVLQAPGGAEPVPQAGRNDEKTGRSKRFSSFFDLFRDVFLHFWCRLRLALSSTKSPTADLAVCFLDLADLSCEERFKARLLRVKNI